MTSKVLQIVFIFSFILSFSQVKFAAKTNLLFPMDTPTWKNISTNASQAYEAKGKTNVGFNAGFSLKINLVNTFFVMPELYYTTFKDKHTDSVSNTTFEAKSERADLPVLLGLNLIGNNLGVFAGPVASYHLSKENQYNDFVENAKNQFTIGYQFGAQFKVKNLIFTGRYEGAITEDQREFINKNTTQTIRYDNRPSFLVAGVGYQF